MNRITKMSDMSMVTMALLAGLLLGGLFYGGLWWTVRRSVSLQHRGVWLIGSFLVRAAVVVGGFYVVARSDWRALLACLLGFFVARIGVTRLTRVSLDRENRLKQGLRP